MVKMNFTNDQTAFEYALYMIAASYFDKAECVSQMRERNMLLQYKEQKIAKQYQMEETCIAFMDKLSNKLPSQFFHRTVEVRLNRKTSGLTEIVFWSEQGILMFRTKYDRKKPKITYRMWKKSNKKNCHYIPEEKKLTCGDCSRFSDDLACLGCLPEDSAYINNMLCRGFFDKQ